jgi:exodeoxyribonuclease VII small subunit
MSGAGEFEAGLEELGRIVQDLEQGDLPLEVALTRFESGVGLVRQLRQRLEHARLRVQLLQEDGSLVEAPDLVPG